MKPTAAIAPPPSAALLALAAALGREAAREDFARREAARHNDVPGLAAQPVDNLPRSSDR